MRQDRHFTAEQDLSSAWEDIFPFWPVVPALSTLAVLALLRRRSGRLLLFLGGMTLGAFTLDQKRKEAQTGETESAEIMRQEKLAQLSQEPIGIKDEVDEASWESFPASDPPSHYKT